MNVDTRPRGAVVIFADAVRADLARRRWPARLKNLLALPSFRPETFGGADVFLCTPEARTTPAGAPRELRQHGATFGERLENAVTDVTALGYDRVVIVGRDCPELTAADVAAAFDALAAGSRLVLGPDHRGGCYLIALNAADRPLLAGVRWQQDEDFADLASRAGDGLTVLSTKLDLDISADLALLARLPAWRRAVAAWSGGLAGSDCIPARDVRRVPEPHPLRAHWQLPPPPRSFAA